MSSISRDMRDAAERAAVKRAEVGVMRVLKGAPYLAERNGGFIRIPAPCDGVVIGDGERSFFVALDKLRDVCR